MFAPFATGAEPMLDLVYLALGFGSFALVAGYVALCRTL
jgi:hypothetical protein